MNKNIFLIIILFIAYYSYGQTNAQATGLDCYKAITLDHTLDISQYQMNIGLNLQQILLI